MDPTSDPIPQVSCIQEQTDMFSEQETTETLQTTLGSNQVASTQLTMQERHIQVFMILTEQPS